ncbi:MAG: hypothetical protein A3E84_03685 [Gammaproteobacteria bacterium RIFCSPHIGHO2_12_FULL_42_13]|nr:MAG: hypothetical protein A3E84_03685 [Gammaproteobacteria bacterium RIFCSPHIGHO2_12_FULL_42_13]
MTRKIINYIIDRWRLLACTFVLASRSVGIIISSYLKNINHRQYINRSTQNGAKAILAIIKANYRLEIINPAAFDTNDVYIFMSNHRSLLDIPLIFATLPWTVRPVAKAPLFRIPFLGRAMRIGECIPVDRHHPANKENVLAETKQKLASGVSVWFFPEGTRSAEDQLLPFKRGGFQLACETNTKIVPVGILNTGHVLKPKTWRIASDKTLTIRIGTPIDVSHYREAEQQPRLLADVRGAIETLAGYRSYG